MNFNLKDIYSHMGVFALIVAWTLIIMAVSALAVFFERMFVFARSNRRNRLFGAKASMLLEEHEHEALAREAAGVKGSPLAKLIAKGMRTFLDKKKKPSVSVSAVELTRRELERESERLTTEVRRGLSLLATVGSVAPFVGLLGTVVGIIDSFQGIAKEGSGGLGAVSGGIAESLVVTALGLLVAIPAVFFYNLCATRSEAILQGLDQARGELIDYLDEHGSRSTPVSAKARDEATGNESPVLTRSSEGPRVGDGARP